MLETIYNLIIQIGGISILAILLVSPFVKSTDKIAKLLSNLFIATQLGLVVFSMLGIMYFIAFGK